jgi:hypothetical protein
MLVCTSCSFITREAWLQELHHFLHRHMRADHLHRLRSLPLLPTSLGLVAASSTPAIFASVPPALLNGALGSGAIRLVEPTSCTTPEQKALMLSFGVVDATPQRLVHAVLQQHASAAFSSLKQCWLGLELVRVLLSDFVTAEAARATGPRGATQALAWVRATILMPCTDGCLRAAHETFLRTVLGHECLQCCSELPKRRPELPPRLVTAASTTPTARQRTERLLVREAFERQPDGRNQMISKVRSVSTRGWSGARCSAGVSNGRVAWSVRWPGGDCFVGANCISSDPSQPGPDRHSIALLIESSGALSLVYAGEQQALVPACPCLERGDTLTIALDVDAGVLLFARQDSLLPTAAHLRGSLSQRSRSVATAYLDVKPFVVALPRQLLGAQLFPVVGVRRGSGEADAETEVRSPQQLFDCTWRCSLIAL